MTPLLLKKTAVAMLAAAGMAFQSDRAAGQAATAPAPSDVAAAPFVGPLKWTSSGVLIEPVSDDAHEIVVREGSLGRLLRRHVARLRDDGQRPGRQLEHRVL